MVQLGTDLGATGSVPTAPLAFEEVDQGFFPFWGVWVLAHGKVEFVGADKHGLWMGEFFESPFAVICAHA